MFVCSSRIALPIILMSLLFSNTDCFGQTEINGLELTEFEKQVWSKNRNTTNKQLGLLNTRYFTTLRGDANTPIYRTELLGAIPNTDSKVKLWVITRSFNGYGTAVLLVNSTHEIVDYKELKFGRLERLTLSVDRERSITVISLESARLGLRSSDTPGSFITTIHVERVKGTYSLKAVESEE